MDPAKDQRIQELRDINEWVRLWHDYNRSSATNTTLSAGAKSAKGFSHQLLFDTSCCIQGFLGLLKDLEQRHGTGDAKAGTGVRLIARKLTQDALESM